MLVGRDAELAAIAGLLDAARGGRSGALVLRGEPGIGKTALLDHAAGAATDLSVLRCRGIEQEAELAFAGLHMLLRPALGRIDALPDVQRRALRAALGLAPPEPDDRFLVGLAVLSLLADPAETGPVLCLVDDAHWLDRPSAEALLFAARRLDAEGVAVILAARDADFPAPGLPDLRLAGLDVFAAAALLAADLPAPDRYAVLGAAAGNPLALIELPKALRTAVRGDGPLPLTDRMRQAYDGRLRDLPGGTRTLLLIAAAEEAGDLTVILRAGAELGVAAEHLDAAQQAGLIQVAGRAIAFRHPLVRAAVLHAAPVSRRLAAHRALAAAFAADGNAERRVWHRAAAATVPDEDIAADLERAAARAGERTGHASAAAAYERAAALSADPVARDRRRTLAAESTAEAGDLAAASELAERARPADPELAARCIAVRAWAAFGQGSHAAAYRLITSAAELIERADPAGAARMLIEAVHIGWYTGERELLAAVERLAALSEEDALVRLVRHAVSPIVGRPAVRADLDGLLAAARRAAAGSPADLIVVSGIGLILGREEVTHDIAAELAAAARERGRVGELPAILFYLATAQQYLGLHGDARTTAAEGLAIAEDTAQQKWTGQFAEVFAQLAAFAGDEAECRRRTERALNAADPAWSVPWVYAALGVLDLGLGRAESALARLESLAAGRRNFHIHAIRSTPDLVEAAVRAGRERAAAEPLARYERWAAHIRQPWARALVHRCRALLARGDSAEDRYRAALAPPARPFEHARTQLLYGEWLRRGKRKAEAAAQFRPALETFERLAATPWATRTRAELDATGTAAPPRLASGPLARLTAQELQIVRLAARGLSNKDIAARLFLSPRTIGHHLYKAFPKLGIASRAELAGLPLTTEPGG